MLDDSFVVGPRLSPGARPGSNPFGYYHTIRVP